MSVETSWELLTRLLQSILIIGGRNNRGVSCVLFAFSSWIFSVLAGGKSRQNLSFLNSAHVSMHSVLLFPWQCPIAESFFFFFWLSISQRRENMKVLEWLIGPAEMTEKGPDCSNASECTNAQQQELMLMDASWLHRWFLINALHLLVPLAAVSRTLHYHHRTHSWAHTQGNPFEISQSQNSPLPSCVNPKGIGLCFWSGRCSWREIKEREPNAFDPAKLFGSVSVYFVNFTQFSLLTLAPF